jgi:hypothetical protein
MWGFGNKKEEPKKEETKVVKQETKTKVKFLYSGPVGEYPGWK